MGCRFCDQVDFFIFPLQRVCIYLLFPHTLPNSQQNQSYSGMIRENNINGEVLLSMKSKEDWKDAGVSNFGDLRMLVKKVANLIG